MEKLFWRDIQLSNQVMKLTKPAYQLRLAGYWI